MKHSEQKSALIKLLNKTFKWNKAHLNCFAGMLFSLLIVRTVNLNELASAFNGKASLLSKYRRLQRFFAEFQMNYKLIAKFLFSLFPFKNKVYLSMDRTNWKWGKSNINILMLGVVYKGVAIPLIWKLLDKQGASNPKERIDVIEKFISWFGKDKIKGLLADREFVGKVWFKWLLENEIPFYIRLKDNVITTNENGLEIYLKDLFGDLNCWERRVLLDKRKLWDFQVYLSGSTNQHGTLMVVATNVDPVQAIDLYLKRWEIETLFGCFKSRGFNFEDTHITDLKRIKKVIVLLAISFCWSHRIGEWQNEIKPIKIKSHGRLSKSIFRYGLDYLRESFYNPENTKIFTNCLKQLQT